MSVTDLKHIYWRSRRGMLELELKLVPFVRDHFAALSADEQHCYECLLGEEDWQIFDWLQGREVPEDVQTAALVEKIRASRGRL
ncbi:MAG: succinate dehydrogenase assembly factor 2 [Pseudomonadota bacterium]